MVRVGALAVQLIDEGQARHTVASHLPIHSDGLRLHARHATQDQDRAVEHAQRALDLDGEVDVAGSVDYVDFVVSPCGVRGGRLDGDALLALELHEVHLCTHPVLASHLVDRADPAGVVEDALSERRLPRVNVRRDADVAHALEGVAGGGGERARGKPSHPSAVRRSRAQPHAQHAALPTRAPDAATEEGGETRKNHTRNAL
eukprot:scaffold49507_cov30-Tisochrysis_lutea.AAC.1